MAIEIERKFLVRGDGWRSQATGIVYRQGYIASTPGKTVRVRVVGDRGYLTIKGTTVGYRRSEFEYPIPVEDAQEMLATLCDPPLIEKKRYQIPAGDLIWEIDEFFGDNEGLIVAEIELLDEGQIFDLPEWIGEEVSHDSRYYNVNLIRYPYRHWTV
ncbi:MAG: CYTH domain-containing protein [Limnospira sp.]